MNDKHSEPTDPEPADEHANGRDVLTVVRVIAGLLFLLLLVGSCSALDDDRPVASDGVDHSIVDPSLIIVSRDEAAAARQVLEGNIETEYASDGEGGPGNYGELIADRYGPAAADGIGPLELLNRVIEQTIVFELVDEAPPIRRMVGQLWDAGVNARPLHVAEFEGHWGLSPGVGPHFERDPDEAEDMLNTLSSSARRLNPSRAIVVVDSGFLDLGERNFVEFDPERDIETIDAAIQHCVASHGTFVAGLIARHDPGAALIGVKAPFVEREVAASSVGPDGAVGDEDLRLDPTCEVDSSQEGDAFFHDITDELGVLLAMARGFETAKRSFADADVAFNLSLGSYGVHLEGHPPLPPFFLQLGVEELADIARERGVDITVFAAGGNQAVNSEYYPGAFKDVVAVSALGLKDEWVRWDDDGRERSEKVGALSGWISGLAPGCHLVGPGAAQPGEMVVWSGSSFATAVATAMDAKTRDGSNILVDRVVVGPVKSYELAVPQCSEPDSGLVDVLGIAPCWFTGAFCEGSEEPHRGLQTAALVATFGVASLPCWRRWRLNSGGRVG